MFPDPSTTRIIHDTMIAEELARRNPDHCVPEERAAIRLPGIRRGTAQVLIRLAGRIMPVPDPEPTAA